MTTPGGESVADKAVEGVGVKMVCVFGRFVPPVNTFEITPVQYSVFIEFSFPFGQPFKLVVGEITGTT